MRDISIVIVKSSSEGVMRAKEILEKTVSKDTALFLSGGRTPKELYEEIAKEATLTPGAVGQVDERYGKKWHENSNELMIKNSGLIAYLDNINIKFYPILQSARLHPKGVGIENTALQYDKTVRDLFKNFQKSIGILGIGADGHIASIPAGKNQESRIKNQDYVESINNFPAEQEERITLTFKGLSKLDLIVVLVFGQDKKEALEKMFEKGSEEEVPARFYLRPEIAQKTLLITDQTV